MQSSTEHPLQAVMAPWVIVLVALIGLNGITQDYSRIRRGDFAWKSAISQPADVPSAPGNFSNQLVFVTPCSTCRVAFLVSRPLGLEVFHKEPSIKSPQGAIRGRAPPTGALS